MRNVSFLHHLSIQSFFISVYGLLDGYFTLLIIQYNFISLLKSYLLFILGILSVRSCVPLTPFQYYYHYYYYYFKALSYFLVHIVHSLAQKSAISPRSHDSFNWRMVLETKIWPLGVLIAIAVSVLPGHLGWQSKESYVYTLACV